MANLNEEKEADVLTARRHREGEEKAADGGGGRVVESVPAISGVSIASFFFKNLKRKNRGERENLMSQHEFTYVAVF